MIFLQDSGIGAVLSPGLILAKLRTTAQRADFATNM